MKWLKNGRLKRAGVHLVSNYGACSSRLNNDASLSLCCCVCAMPIITYQQCADRVLQMLVWITNPVFPILDRIMALLCCRLVAQDNALWFELASIPSMVRTDFNAMCLVHLISPVIPECCSKPMNDVYHNIIFFSRFQVNLYFLQ